MTTLTNVPVLMDWDDNELVPCSVTIQTYWAYGNERRTRHTIHHPLLGELSERAYACAHEWVADLDDVVAAKCDLLAADGGARLFDMGGAVW